MTSSFLKPSHVTSHLAVSDVIIASANRCARLTFRIILLYEEVTLCKQSSANAKLYGKAKMSMDATRDQSTNQFDISIKLSAILHSS